MGVAVGVEWEWRWNDSGIGNEGWNGSRSRIGVVRVE